MLDTKLYVSFLRPFWTLSLGLLKGYKVMGSTLIFKLIFCNCFTLLSKSSNASAVSQKHSEITSMMGDLTTVFELWMSNNVGRLPFLWGINRGLLLTTDKNLARRMTFVFRILELPVWNLNPKSSNAEIFEIFFSTSAQIKPRPPFSYPFQMIMNWSNYNSIL
jgi:hypothetical protein